MLEHAAAQVVLVLRRVTIDKPYGRGHAVVHVASGAETALLFSVHVAVEVALVDLLKVEALGLLGLPRAAHYLLRIPTTETVVLNLVLFILT